MVRKNWNHVKDIFNDALRQDTGERAGFLDTACGGDIDLRIEVESLLIAYEEGKSFLETPVIGETSKTNSWRLSNGQIISHFKIVSPIASGGMGEVYLAEDQNLRRQVALKVLPELMNADKDRMRRFQREAQAVSTLNHPNILTIFEFAEEDSMHIFASEFVKGETLRDQLGRGRLPVSETLDIGIQIASALRAAHAAGVIHRDIKPENIMIRDDGFVKVLDFGLAKLTERHSVDFEADTKKIFSQPGVIMGTVTYMSPEQARARTIDARSDLFSFGVVLFEMLTGRVPFAGETTTDVIAEIIQATPRLASSYNSAVPDEMDRLIAKCLEKDRDERYQTAADLLADLKRISKRSEPTAEPATKASTAIPLAGQPTELLTDRPTEHSVSVSQPARKRGLALAGAIAATIAAIAIGYWYYNGQNTKQIDSIAVMPFVNESGNADIEYLSDGMTETLISSLSQLPNLNVKARSSVFRYKGKGTDAQTIGKELNVQAILNGRVVQRGQDLILYVELVDAATENSLWKQTYNKTMTNLVALQNDIARDIADKLKVKLSGADEQKLSKKYTENAEAYQLYLKGRYFWYKRTPKDLEKSRDFFQQAIDLDPTYALAYSGLADYYGFSAAQGFLPPDKNWPKAEAAAEKALTLDGSLAEAYNPLAAVKLYYYRDWPAAEQLFRRGIELNPNYVETRLHYAGRLAFFGRYEEALAENQRAIDLDPLSARSNLGRARMFFFMRQYDSALAQLQKTLELDRNYARAHELAGDVYEKKGMQREAITAWSKALTLSGESEQASNLERSYAASGFDSAVRALAQKQLERVKERTDRGEYVPAIEYMTAYTRLGDKEQAFVWLAKVVEERSGDRIEVNVNPIFDSLRDDPRFQDLMRRVGLPQ